MSMNRTLKAMAALMLMMVFAVSCNKPDEPNNDAPEEPIVGLFSINDSTQVCFSPGNLQYQASTNTWRFAEHQWDYIGEGNANISETYDGWIDLFGWGSGNHPTHVSTNAYDTVYNTFVDWGVNCISNWSDSECQWHTLDWSAWHYLLFQRNTHSGIYYVAATIDGIKGLVLLPDNWDETVFDFLGFNNNGSTFDTNILTISQWEKIEMNGAAFLPAAGIRTGITVQRVQDSGLYWIAGPSQPIWGYVYYVQFYGGQPSTPNYCDRCCGLSVRLVRDAE